MFERRLIQVIAAVGLVAALAGCGSAATSSASAPPADGGTFGTVADLRDAFTRAGGTCDNWKEAASPTFSAAQQGNCNYLTFSTYATDDDKQVYITYFRDYSAGGNNAILVGQNWLILGAADLIAEAESLLGGVVVDATR